MIILSKTNEKLHIENKIELLRKKMIHIGIQDGLTSERTIKLSQELDTYIAIYQRIIY